MLSVYSAYTYIHAASHRSSPCNGNVLPTKDQMPLLTSAFLNTNLIDIRKIQFSPLLFLVARTLLRLCGNSYINTYYVLYLWRYVYISIMKRASAICWQTRESFKNNFTSKYIYVYLFLTLSRFGNELRSTQKMLIQELIEVKPGYWLDLVNPSLDLNLIYC